MRSTYSAGLAHTYVSQTAHSPKRVRSLDALRGITITLMLLVNNVPSGIKVPLQFKHAEWGNMIHLADLVFPWLLFCAGVAIPLARAAFLRHSLPAWHYYQKVLVRSLLLFGLGCAVQSSLAKQFTLSLGVLQLIALAYMVAALLSGMKRRHRLLSAIVLLASYWAVIRYLPIPGHQPGTITETDNLIYYLNTTFLGQHNLWGLPSIVPTAALTLLGTLVGDWLRSRKTGELQKVVRMLVVGGLFVWLGFLWHTSVPFSKSIWSPAYILLTAGLATMALAILYVIVDWAGGVGLVYPFVMFGSNAMLAYVAPIMAKVWVLRAFTTQWKGATVTWEQGAIAALVHRFGNPNGYWIYLGLFLATWWLVLWILYRKRWFLRV